MSSIVKQSLFAVALLSVAMVESAPMDSTKSASKNTKAAAASKTKSYLSSPSSSAKSLRRGKRNVIIQEIPEDAIVATEEDVLREQLADLSDDQLEMLAGIVQSEINRYEPRLDAYEIVELPEYLTQELEYMPRDRRSVPISFEPFGGDDMLTDQLQNEEVVFIPEEELIAQEAANEQEDELELRQRIAEIAEILNERATRRVRFV